VVLAALREERAAPPRELARRTGAPDAHRADSAAEGLELARRLAGPDGRVVVAGSLYLVGEVLDALDRERAAG
jgi:folylpolyglutamate synthase/dihydropteroate synthase